MHGTHVFIFHAYRICLWSSVCNLKNKCFFTDISEPSLVKQRYNYFLICSTSEYCNLWGVVSGFESGIHTVFYPTSGYPPETSAFLNCVITFHCQIYNAFFMHTEFVSQVPPVISDTYLYFRNISESSLKQSTIFFNLPPLLDIVICGDLLHDLRMGFSTIMTSNDSLLSYVTLCFTLPLDIYLRKLPF
jgi:hypothetical protein